MIVVKADGRKERFNMSKICVAVEKAGADMQLAEDIALVAEMSLKESVVNPKTQVTIKQIHQVVENLLMQRNPDVARAYIEYRSNRDRVRLEKSALGKAVKGLLNQTDEITKENANKNAKLISTQRDLLAGIVAKQFAKEFVLPAHIVEAHEAGILHYHDLDYSPFMPMTNCCLVALKGMLHEGFRMGNADIETPNSIGVACAVMSQITAQVASNQYGGTTFANVDQVLAPYVAKTYAKHMEVAMEEGIDDALGFAARRTEKDVYDAFQAYEYEVNTLHTTCGQTPFVTITFGMGTSWYERLIQQAILRVRIKGLGKHGITPTFPKLVMFMERGLNMEPNDPNYDIKKLALECASKRMYPDIISAANNRKLTGSSVPVSPMGCRSFLSVWKDENGEEVLDGRNNLGVVSLNLPRVAIEAHGSIDEFYKLLEARLELCHEALETRIKSLKGVKASTAPILYMHGAFGKRLKPDDDIIELFKGHRSSISLGYIGLYEVGELMCKGKTEQEKDKFRVKVLTLLNETTKKWKDASEFGYSLYSTPAESLCYRFAKLDTEQFGVIENITDKGYYTNSFHADVRAVMDPFSKINKEAPYHFIATGGHISYVEGPSVVDNLEALETVWDYAMDRLDYFGFNTPVDKCFECGSTKELTCTEDGFVCSVCGNKDQKRMNATRRTCGYLGAMGFNKGKTKEIMLRTKHISLQ